MMNIVVVMYFLGSEIIHDAGKINMWYPIDFQLSFSNKDGECYAVDRS